MSYPGLLIGTNLHLFYVRLPIPPAPHPQILAQEGFSPSSMTLETTTCLASNFSSYVQSNDNAFIFSHWAISKNGYNNIAIFTATQAIEMSMVRVVNRANPINHI